jgi:hypothetical protein
VLSIALAILPTVAGVLVAAWRFRAHDPLTGTGCALAGIFLMLGVIRFLPDAR